LTRIGRPHEHFHHFTGKETYNCIDKHPKLRVGFLESGGGWIVPWLERMDRHFDDQVSMTPACRHRLGWVVGDAHRSCLA
jgi:hypothetical protein